MAYDEELARRIDDLLDGEPGVTRKKMFGGLGFMVDGHLAVAAASKGSLMVRADPGDAEAWADGFFLLPAVVLDAQPDDEIVREEQFGPILPVIAYDTEEQAVALANDTEYGLCSSVWSRSTVVVRNA